MARSHVIDGVTYVEVDRDANVGDYVVIKSNGVIRKVVDRGDFGIFYSEGKPGILDHGYHTLEPLESEEVTVDSSQASEQVIEMFTALSRKIVSLERQLADTQRNVERQAEELEDVKYNAKKHVERLTCDIITLDERTQVVNAITKFYEDSKR
jgi:hypothetical protein